MQHFFADKDLNFDVLNRDKFLDDMLGERVQEEDQDRSEDETPEVEEAQEEAQDGFKVPAGVRNGAQEILETQDMEEGRAQAIEAP